ncbi:MAG: DUF2339 domain-containing protein [Pseudomonadota bacterium]
MRLILIIAGLIIGIVAFEGSRSFSGALMGAGLCMFFGFLLRGKQRNASEDDLRELREHFDRVTQEINQRLSALEKTGTDTPVSPTHAKPPRQPIVRRAAEGEKKQFHIEQSAPLPTDDGRSQSWSKPATDWAPHDVVPEETVAASTSNLNASEEIAPLPPSAEVSDDVAPAELPAPSATPTPARQPLPAFIPPPPSLIERGFTAFRNWLFGGNTLVRVGILLLFLGLAFLLRYAADRVVVPIELRYAGVALTSVVLLVIGWKVRARQHAYGLLLQGAAIAVMYLTVFAAMRLHPLVPPQMGFVLLVVVAVCSAILAIKQDALALAAAGVAGGFAAPILASTGGGSHVALFSYFTLLNGGIFAIAWFKAWRVLNLIGFVGTFGIGFAWGLRSYKPELFASTEAFLLLFFFMYVAIGLLFARRVLHDADSEPVSHERHVVLRWAAEQANYLDGTILFGTPLIAFGLQYAVIQHLHFGPAFSALGLGFFYLSLASVLFRRTQWRYLLLVEIDIALGVIFATLSIPLGLDAQWTAAAWAVEGAGIYWIGHRQQRPLARIFALLLQLGAGLYYLSTLSMQAETSMLSGDKLGAAMLGISLLFSYWQLRSVEAEQRASWEKPVLGVLARAGLAFLYLLAPLFFHADITAAVWAVAGIVTMHIGLRLQDRCWMTSALLIQALGGVVFLLRIHTPTGDAADVVFASGFKGLLIATSIGAAALICFVLALRDTHTRQDAKLMRSMSMVLLFGLVFINLAVLFLLPWRVASAVWAGSGLLILWLSLGLQQRLGFAFGLILQLIGGMAFLSAAYPALQALSPGELKPLAHSGFWTPALIAFAAFVAAWRLHRAPPTTDTSLPNLGVLSFILLVWGASWWAFAVLTEVFRFVPPEARIHISLLTASGTIFVWSLAARYWQWQSLAKLCALMVPVTILALFYAYNANYHPSAHWGAAAWLAAFAVHLLMLRNIAQLLPSSWTSLLHVVGCWVILSVLALEIRFAFISLSEHYNAWRWLGWISVPSMYLLLMASQKLSKLWPFSSYEREYRAVAALPVAVVMLAWFWISNVASDGTADPIAYFPLLNPLELGQFLVMVSLLYWLKGRFGLLPIAEKFSPAFPYWVMGASALFMITCAVFRATHHWAGIPYRFDALFASMLVQASLSLIWSLVALGLMISGHARKQRYLWIVGSVLIAVVVAKLFLIELSNKGGLERIVSFIGVGVLLLVVGYFAPLPPKNNESQLAKEEV